MAEFPPNPPPLVPATMVTVSTSGSVRTCSSNHFAFSTKRLVGDVLLADDGAVQAPRILLREKSFRDLDVKVDVSAYRKQHGEQDSQRDNPARRRAPKHTWR